MMVSEFIQKSAPAGASFYRLQIKFSNNTVRLYPPSSEGYVVGQAPVGTPPGRYEVCFYDSERRQLVQQEPLTVELGLESLRSSGTQLGINFLNASGSARTNTAPPGHEAEWRAPAGSEAETQGLMPRPQSAPPTSADAEQEMRRYLHVMDMEERQQEFIKNSTYVTEVGELFALNRIMRREMMEMQRVIVHQSQQAHKDIDLMKSTLRDLFKLQQEALDKAAELIPRPPPPPPPDYVGLGHSALGVLREIGVALINRTSAGERGATLRSTGPQPQLPAASIDNKEEEIPATTPGSSEKSNIQSVDIIEKMINKIRATSDIDLAIAMSSPSNWKALMDDLLPKTSEPAPPTEQSEPPAGR